MLSSHLAEPGWFRSCNPADLAAPTRLARIMDKLQPHIEAGAIICLQEVSRAAWAEPLRDFFHKSDYEWHFSAYGRAFNGHMGVALAYPRRYTATRVETLRVADHKPWPAPAQGLLARMWHAVSGLLGQRLCGGGRGQADAWTAAQARENVMIHVQLAPTAPDGAGADAGAPQPRFCVGTYHMPCAFREPAVMTIHAALAAQAFHALSAGLPGVLAGDFNFQPDSACYSLLAAGRLDAGRFPEAEPPARSFDPWQCDLPVPMQSAYAACQGGREPEFTNFAQARDEPPFIGTLDYLFATPECRPLAVLPLPALEGFAGPMPTASEPSDHLLIGGTFQV